MDIDELAPDMGHTGNFAEVAETVDILKPGIAVGMHPALSPDRGTPNDMRSPMPMAALSGSSSRQVRRAHYIGAAVLARAACQRPSGSWPIVAMMLTGPGCLER